MPSAQVPEGTQTLQALEACFLGINAEKRKIWSIFHKPILRDWFEKEKLSYSGGTITVTTLDRCKLSRPTIARWVLKNLWFKASASFVKKLYQTCLKKGGWKTIQRWFHTADGAVLPYILTCKGLPDLKIVDELSRFALENCANNYSLFLSQSKTVKKLIRKGWAFNGKIPPLTTYRGFCRYVHHYKMGLPSRENREESARYTLIWSQTRATGLADHNMMVKALNKFESTITSKPKMVTPDFDVLSEPIQKWIGTKTNQFNLVVSAGPTACLQSTRKEGGKTGFLHRLAKHKCLYKAFDLFTLKSTDIPRRPVRSARQLLDWCLQEIFEHPIWVRIVRVHAVVEPSKARTVTISHYAFTLLMGLFSHLFLPIFRGESATRSGLGADRHLWNFIHNTLHNLDIGWDTLGPEADGPIYGLSVDLEEATDYGNPSFGHQCWMALLAQAGFTWGDSFPMALGVLAKNLHMGKRYVLFPSDRKGFYRRATKIRGWLMGDMMTKVILTQSTDYACRQALKNRGLHNVVGDDVLALSRYRERLRQILVELERIDMKISMHDTYVSRDLAFYCEEGMIIPQKPFEGTAPMIKMGRRAIKYLDYPRIRLLLETTSETDSYSYTNQGRNALLGKEAKWAYSTSSLEAQEIFSRAQLLQQFLLRRDKDTICPYLPIEIGGDGNHPHSSSFLDGTIRAHARDRNEVNYRINQLLEGNFSFRYVRSERLDQVVHKHHVFLPLMEESARFFEPSSLIVPTTPEQRALYGSLRVKNIVPASQACLRLVKMAYYYALFHGKELPELKLSISRELHGVPTHQFEPDLVRFIQSWKNPGFRFKNLEPYWVHNVEPKNNPMYIGLHLIKVNPYSNQPLVAAGQERIISLLLDRSLDQVLSAIAADNQVPEIVKGRLPLYIESDNYILATLDKSKVGQDILLVSEDRRLGDQISRIMKSRVVLVQPIIYLVGRMDELKDIQPFHPGWVREWNPQYTIVDEGAVFYSDLANFKDGWPVFEDPDFVFTEPIKVRLFSGDRFTTESKYYLD